MVFGLKQKPGKNKEPSNQSSSYADSSSGECDESGSGSSGSGSYESESGSGSAEEEDEYDYGYGDTNTNDYGYGYADNNHYGYGEETEQEASSAKPPSVEDAPPNDPSRVARRKMRGSLGFNSEWMQQQLDAAATAVGTATASATNAMVGGASAVGGAVVGTATAAANAASYTAKATTSAVVATTTATANAASYTAQATASAVVATTTATANAATSAAGAVVGGGQAVVGGAATAVGASIGATASAVGTVANAAQGAATGTAKAVAVSARVAKRRMRGSIGFNNDYMVEALEQQQQQVEPVPQQEPVLEPVPHPQHEETQSDDGIGVDIDNYCSYSQDKEEEVVTGVTDKDNEKTTDVSQDGSQDQSQHASASSASSSYESGSEEDSSEEDSDSDEEEDAKPKKKKRGFLRKLLWPFKRRDKDKEKKEEAAYSTPSLSGSSESSSSSTSSDDQDADGEPQQQQQQHLQVQVQMHGGDIPYQQQQAQQYEPEGIPAVELVDDCPTRSVQRPPPELPAISTDREVFGQREEVKYHAPPPELVATPSSFSLDSAETRPDIMLAAKLGVSPYTVTATAVKIQSWCRMKLVVLRLEREELQELQDYAATIIQARWKCYIERIYFEITQKAIASAIKTSGVKVVAATSNKKEAGGSKSPAPAPSSPPPAPAPKKKDDVLPAIEGKPAMELNNYDSLTLPPKLNIPEVSPEEMLFKKDRPAPPSAKAVAATKIQSIWRMRNVELQLETAHFAITMVQSQWRSYSGRNKYLLGREAAAKYKNPSLKDHHAATKLQSAWRMHMVATELEIAHYAVTMIQAQWRCFCIRSKCVLAKEPAMQYISYSTADVLADAVLESCWPMKLVGEELTKIHSSATSIQAQWRAYSARSMYLISQEAVASALARPSISNDRAPPWLPTSTPQASNAAAGCNISKQAAVAASSGPAPSPEVVAATKIQSAWRMKNVFMELEIAHFAVTILQSKCRAYFGRSRYLLGREAAFKYNNPSLKDHQAATKIQSAWRMKMVALELEIAHYAITKVQSQWRCFCIWTKCILAKEPAMQYISYSAAVVLADTEIESCWPMQIIGEEFAKIHSAAEVLQSQWRAYTVRKMSLLDTRAVAPASSEVANKAEPAPELYEEGVPARELNNYDALTLPPKLDIPEVSAEEVQLKKDRPAASPSLEEGVPARELNNYDALTLPPKLDIPEVSPDEVQLKMDHPAAPSVEAAAATKIQSAWRMKNVFMELEIAHFAITMVQSQWRAYSGRNTYLLAREAATKYKNPSLEEHQAATKIRSAWRMKRVFMQLEIAHFAVTMIQSQWRCFCIRSKYLLVKEPAMHYISYSTADVLVDTEIENCWPLQLVGEELTKIHSAATVTQSQWRTYSARKMYLLSRKTVAPASSEVASKAEPAPEPFERVPAMELNNYDALTLPPKLNIPEVSPEEVQLKKDHPEASLSLEEGVPAMELNNYDALTLPPKLDIPEVSPDEVQLKMDRPAVSSPEAVAATKIQSAWRMKMVALELEIAHYAITMVQSQWRCFCIKSKYMLAKEPAMQYISSSTAEVLAGADIESCWPMQLIGEELTNIYSAAIVIQSQWRACAVRKMYLLSQKMVAPASSEVANKAEPAPEPSEEGVPAMELNNYDALMLPPKLDIPEVSPEEVQLKKDRPAASPLLEEGVPARELNNYDALTLPPKLDIPEVSAEEVQLKKDRPAASPSLEEGVPARELNNYDALTLPPKLSIPQVSPDEVQLKKDRPAPSQPEVVKPAVSPVIATSSVLPQWRSYHARREALLAQTAARKYINPSATQVLAATKIQSAWRMTLVLMDLDLAHYVASLIQAQWRGCSVRSKSLVCWEALLKYLNPSSATEVLAAATKIQSNWRMHRAHSAAAAIQSQWRAHCTRAKYLKLLSLRNVLVPAASSAKDNGRKCGKIHTSKLDSLRQKRRAKENELREQFVSVGSVGVEATEATERGADEDSIAEGHISSLISGGGGKPQHSFSSSFHSTAEIDDKVFSSIIVEDLKHERAKAQQLEVQVDHTEGRARASEERKAKLQEQVGSLLKQLAEARQHADELRDFVRQEQAPTTKGVAETFTSGDYCSSVNTGSVPHAQQQGDPVQEQELSSQPEYDFSYDNDPSQRGYGNGRDSPPLPQEPPSEQQEYGRDYNSDPYQHSSQQDYYHDYTSPTLPLEQVREEPLQQEEEQEYGYDSYEDPSPKLKQQEQPRVRKVSFDDEYDNQVTEEDDDDEEDAEEETEDDEEEPVHESSSSKRGKKRGQNRWLGRIFRKRNKRANEPAQ